jgi:hypothetical protein
LTALQTIVFLLYLVLFVYSTLALLDEIKFEWLVFSIAWGSIALVFQVIHCALYLYFKHKVRANISTDEYPVYLVGSPVIRDIHQAVVVSTFSFTIVVYLTVQFLAFKGTGNVEHAVQAPYILVLVMLSLMTLYAMSYAILAQFWPVANIRRITMYFKDRKE